MKVEIFAIPIVGNRRHNGLELKKEEFKLQGQVLEINVIQVVSTGLAL